jgi:drug/metabolite transporter (DMT)-like permease
MNNPQVFQVLLCVIAISAGQVLFKLAALHMEKPGGDGFSPVGLLLNPYLSAGLIVYLAATLFWIWLLRSVPLNIAYPFMGLAFLFVPLIGAVFLNEPLQARLLWGGGLIAMGIYVVTR